MTKDDILRMASESGLSDGPVFFNGLERFANLVAEQVGGLLRIY